MSPDDRKFSRIVARSDSIADVCRALGLVAKGANYERLRFRIASLELDISHFGRKRSEINSRNGKNRARPLSEVLVKGRLENTSTLKKRLVSEGVLQWLCATCGREEWLGERIPLELDHIDGDKTNNELINLRLICPNCHTLTDTYRGRNIGRHLKAEEDPTAPEKGRWDALIDSLGG